MASMDYENENGTRYEGKLPSDFSFQLSTTLAICLDLETRC
jgi:hypothetical protein